MGRLLTCPLGHRWELRATDGDSAVTVNLTCPECGGLGKDYVPTQPATIADTRANAEAKTINTSPPPGSNDATAAWDSIDGGSIPRPAEPALSLRVQLPHYDVLAEIGRGGMGVVYKANHQVLNRLVALKMILAGAHASQQELTRFKTEAEAVAQLVHPNFVQIYDIGEHEGLPFFSLEYVEGGSLAQKIAGTPMPGREAAELIETLARAVHVAHKRGIIHRDLKPANVLLTAEGLPKITDFGLAKRLDSQAGNTRSGAIMGTPSYMAPEQAGDKEKQIGPHTDVYALGAILYEMLTGRPPFWSENPVETVLQVLDHEPEPPRSYNKNVDPSLEAICLKCLEKNPRDRYPRALDLAEDLAAYLRGEPVQADGSTSLRLFRLFLRESRHTEIMAMWGKVWMCHAVQIMLLFFLTAGLMFMPFTHKGQEGDFVTAWPFVILWSVGLLSLVVPVYLFRVRSGLAFTPIERQMGQMWYLFAAGIVATGISQFFAGEQVGLEITSLLPVFMILVGLAFGCMAVILGGSFYGMALACFVLAGFQTAASFFQWIRPEVGVVLFGLVFFFGMFISGWRYSRALIKPQAPAEAG